MQTQVQETIAIRPTGVLSGAVSVFLGLWMFLLSVGTILGIVYIVTQVRDQRQAQRVAQYDRAQRVVSPAFRHQVTQVANDIHAEFAAARHGWREFNSVHENLPDEISSLQTAAHTTHESAIASNLQEFEWTFDQCVKTEIGPHAPSRNLPGCYAESPESKIDQIINN
jgi:hypothetical protein